MKKSFFAFSVFSFLFLDSALSHPWNAANDIQKLATWKKPIEFNIHKLPASGESKKKIWAGDWWPLARGGTARGGRRSPLAKLEKVSPLSVGAYQWELSYSKENKESWGGHCNGLAAAGIAEFEPKRSVIYKGVKFTPKDIKALLIELYQSDYEILGERCENTKLKESSPDYEACLDINPGAFHLALTNIIGLHGKALVADVSSNLEVWNWAVKGFKTAVKEVSNVNGQRVFAVKTKMTTTKATFSYEYNLETDPVGNITGGTWTGKSRTRHPDFIWVVPEDGYRIENPFIDMMAVQEIAWESQY